MYRIFRIPVRPQNGPPFPVCHRYNAQWYNLYRLLMLSLLSHGQGYHKCKPLPSRWQSKSRKRIFIFECRFIVLSINIYFILLSHIIHISVIFMCIYFYIPILIYFSSLLNKLRSQIIADFY